jgi:hypothetical protein
MGTVNHLSALRNPALVSARSKKSISSACCPIFLCSGPRSTGACSFDTALKTPAALADNCFFQSMIWLGCSSNCWHSSAKVLSSLCAAKVTLALNSGLHTRRLRRPDDLLIQVSCLGTLAKAQNPNNLLILPIQFYRATSLFHQRFEAVIQPSNDNTQLLSEFALIEIWVFLQDAHYSEIGVFLKLGLAAAHGSPHLI